MQYLLQGKKYTAGLLVLLIGILMSLGVVSNTQAQDRGCNMTDAMMAPEKPVYRQGEEITLAALSDCSTVKFQMINLDTGEIWDKAEFAGPAQTETIKTAEFPPGNYAAKALARGEGGWENADVRLWLFQIVGPNDPIPAVPAPTQPAPQTLNCPGSEQTLFEAGDIAEFTREYGGKLNVRIRPTTNSIILVEIPPGEVMTVVGPEPECGDGWVWREVGYQGKTGWVAEYSLDGQYRNLYPHGQVPRNSGGGGNTSPEDKTIWPAEVNPHPISASLGSSGVQLIYSPGFDPVSLLDAPRLSGRLLHQMPEGALGNVIEGPVSADGYRWWKVAFVVPEVTGWIADGDSKRAWLVGVGYDIPVMGILPTPRSGGENGHLFPGNCFNAPMADLFVGSRVKVNPAASREVKLYATPQKNALRTLSSNTEMVVVDGLYCDLGQSGPLDWYLVRLDDGTQGWVTTGYEGEASRLVEVGGQSGNVVELIYHYRFFNEVYTFEVDITDTTSCAILNGSEIVAQEINRSRTWLQDNLETQGRIPTLRDLHAYLKSDGHIDTFRLMVESLVLRETDCSHTYYKVGQVTMDLSGLGNVLFGFYTGWFPRYGVHLFADWEQFFKEETRGQFDFPDDASQIDMGRIIGSSELGDAWIMPSEVEQAIPGGFVSSK